MALKVLGWACVLGVEGLDLPEPQRGVLARCYLPEMGSHVGLGSRVRARTAGLRQASPCPQCEGRRRRRDEPPAGLQGNRPQTTKTLSRMCNLFKGGKMLWKRDSGAGERGRGLDLKSAFLSQWPSCPQPLGSAWGRFRLSRLRGAGASGTCAQRPGADVADCPRECKAGPVADTLHPKACRVR